MTDEVKAITEALARPFDPKDVKFKPQMVKNNRCLAMAYIDARLVQDRLDEVLGVENWQDQYRLLPDGSVMCRLKLKLGGQWISKTDVGNQSEQPDAGDRLKSAFSDALKRAAVKFGIARYLYRLKAEWVDYDPVKKQIVQPPTLPAFALPKPHPAARPAPAAARQTAPPAADPETREERAAIEAEGEDPAATDRAACLKLFKATGTTWKDAMLWLTVHVEGAHYHGDTKFADVALDHRRALVAGLRRKPGGREA